MKKTPTQTTSNHTSSRSAPNAPASTAASDLPVIRILSEEEEMHVKFGLEMEDSTHDMLVKWGKEVASDEDYIGIAIKAGLEEYVDALDNKQK